MPCHIPRAPQKIIVLLFSMTDKQRSSEYTAPTVRQNDSLYRLTPLAGPSRLSALAYPTSCSRMPRPVPASMMMAVIKPSMAQRPFVTSTCLAYLQRQGITCQANMLYSIFLIYISTLITNHLYITTNL